MWEDEEEKAETENITCSHQSDNISPQWSLKLDVAHADISTETSTSVWRIMSRKHGERERSC